MKIYIDDREVDFDRSGSISISLSVASLTDIESGKTGHSKEIRLPMTPRNSEIMGAVEQLSGVERFNQEQHTARVEIDGFNVFEGVPMLICCESREQGRAGGYRLSIIGAGREWVKYAAQTPLRALPVEFKERITGENVQKSWSWEQAVRFLPVQRDKFEVENANANLFPPVRALTFEDYHPFLNVRTLLQTLFKEAGYDIESKFVDSDYFGSLYMSGNYPKKSVEELRTLLNFRAGRFATATATANRYGRVHANPYLELNSLGNIVQSADPTDSSSGEPIKGVFTNGGYFTKENQRVVFMPPREVSLSFEYALHYTTDYYMESRERLSGFNIINLGDGVSRRVNISNRNRDRRDEFRSNRSYIAIIFEHTTGSTYQLRYDEVTNPYADPENLTPSDVTTRTHSTFTTRTQAVTIFSENSLLNPTLYERSSGSLTYNKCSDDWALYDGHVKEQGEIEVEVTIRSQPERILPSEPKYFDMIWFGGAEQGAKLTIGQRTTIRPLFAEYPGEGALVEFEDVAAHQITALDFVSALKHLFNLHFYTDRFAKRLFIEPRDSFYLDEPIVDWSNKIDYGRAIVISELGRDVSRRMSFRYGTGDGVVERWNRTNQERFGEWQTTIDNRFAREQQSTYENLYRPSLNLSGSFPDAPAASLLQVGEREYSAVRGEDLNFPPKIVRYLGMVDLPQGQHWGWPLDMGCYPFLAFHHTGVQNLDSGDKPYSSFVEQRNPTKAIENGFSLCFEDRDGVAGLHHHWDSTVEMINDGRRLELYLNLGPEDIEPLITPNDLMCDFRARYRLSIGDEEVICRLEEIVDYNPSDGRSTKCVFVTATRV